MLERVKDNPDDEETREMGKLLFDTAMLHSGYVLDNPSEYARNFYKIFNGALGIPRNAEIEEIEIDLDEEDD
jgi:HSP90 family molecular chaperone